MFKLILVAYDGSPTADGALRIGIELARGMDAELSSISVEEHLPRYAASISEVEGAREQIEEHFRVLTKRARDAAALEGLDLEAVVRQGHEVEEILGFAREGRFDLLVLGAHGHSRVFERIIGSTSLTVARLAPCSVFIARGGIRGATGLGEVKRILLGLDGSPLGRLAFREALDMAVLCGATLAAVTVREASPLTRPERLDGAYVGQLRVAAEEHARAAGIVFEHMTRAGHAAQVLRDEAKVRNADLLVLGATGLEHPWSPTLGGTASGIASEAPCSVLLVRSPRSAMHISEVMMRAVSSVTMETPLAAVVELLLRRNVKALPVMDDRRHVVGIITGGDLLSRGDVRLRLSIKQELDSESLRGQLRALAQSHKAARDIMTRHVHTIGPDVDLAAAIKLMAKHRIKRLPVVNDQAELIGIVSRADVLRAVAALPDSPEPAERELPAAARTVGDATIREVPVVGPEAGSEEVLGAVLMNPLRRVVVVDRESKVLGLISDRDILSRSTPERRPWLIRLLRGQLSEHREPSYGPEGAPTAAALMAPLLVTVRADDSLVHAIRLMMQHQVKRLIVVDQAGRFLGLVDRREVLRLLASVVSS